MTTAGEQRKQPSSFNKRVRAFGVRPFSLVISLLLLIALEFVLLDRLSVSPQCMFAVFAGTATLVALVNAIAAFVMGVPPAQAMMLVAISVGLLIIVYAAAYSEYGLTDVLANEEVHDFPSSLYFSVITCTSVGYGDMQPRCTSLGRLFAASEAFFGYLYMGLSIAICMRLRKWPDEGHLKPP